MHSILIIEDDPSYRDMIETILLMEGFEVRTASDGQTGLAMLREKPTELVLCDIMMTGMDGHSVLGAIRNDKTLAQIPFIFITALGDRSDIRRGMSEGADDYLSKPFTADELLDAVNGRIVRCRDFVTSRDTLDSSTVKEILERITTREREILLLVAKGSTSREIAEQLGVSLRTVEVHRANLMRKLDATNAASLARWAVVAEQI